MNPEELARQNIDQQLAHSGWMAQDMYNLNRFAGRGVAVREFPLETAEADYLLFGEGKAMEVVEAAMRRAGILRQAALKRAFEGRL